MITSSLDERVITEIEKLGQYHRADGVVVTDMPLERVVTLITRNAAMDLEYLDVSSGRKIRPAEVGYELIATCHVVSKCFMRFRDLLVKPGGSGVYDVTATYHWSNEWAGNYGPRHESGNVDFRFHVDNEGRATYIVL